MLSLTGLKLEHASHEDAVEWADCFLRSFTRAKGEQVPFYQRMFPDTEHTRHFFVESFREQMQREKDLSHFIHVRTQDGLLIGFAKWTPPTQKDEAYWADMQPGMDERLCDEFFGLMSTQREKIMGDRPHWFLEIMGVDADHQRRGVGAMMMAYGCKLMDADALEGYVDASPMGRGLYKKHGFELREHYNFSGDFSWYREEFLVRSKGSVK